MDECETEFSSKEYGATKPTIEKQLKAITDKRTFIEQATEVVLSHGKKLQTVIISSRTRKHSYRTSCLGASPISESNNTFLSSSLNVDSSEFRRAQSSNDLLDGSCDQVESSLTSAALIRAGSQSQVYPNISSSHAVSSLLSSSSSPHQTRNQIRKSSWDPWNTHDKNKTILDHYQLKTTSVFSAPKLLPNRRQSSGSLLSAQSVPNVSIVDMDRHMVETFLKEIRSRLNLLMLLWEGRKKRLEEASKAVEFTEAVPHVLEWVESVGAEFLEKYNYYGMSIVEVCKELGSVLQCCFLIVSPCC